MHWYVIYPTALDHYNNVLTVSAGYELNMLERTGCQSQKKTSNDNKNVLRENNVPVFSFTVFLLRHIHQITTHTTSFSSV